MPEISSSEADLPELTRISTLITEMQQQLQLQQPGYESLLHRIHRDLSAREDVVHLLTEDQIGAIFAGLSKKKNIIINEVKIKERAKKSLKQTTADDI